ncbi:pentatricopeptide repeat-containing protein At1g08070, chloroplastic-like [Impatiens glandulifera]|uniref:pentatricopeptide repeat-containing protein At1g08070, chloroplastic-like n=1 Tax=Impatiens glandulifera TaxID=253017 RepID=UPI001FB0BF8D|nr:pentatricopeptide repeat-containing protein At1g08070, chloroplastic-like [Impatiens glandulifera]
MQIAAGSLKRSNRSLRSSSPNLQIYNEHFSNPLSAIRNVVGDDLTLNHPILQALESCGCGSRREFDQVHTQLLISGLFQHSLVSGRVVKKLCSSPSTLPHAVTLFESFNFPDAFLCNHIFRSFLNSNEPHGALSFYYNQMMKKSVKLNHYTFPLLARVIVESGFLIEGEKIHSCVVKSGLESDLFIRNGLIHMYSTFNRIRDARALFDFSPVTDLVTWNSIIDGYSKNGELILARQVFDEMPERDIISWNTIIAGYSSSGDMEEAKALFETMKIKDIVSWNSMIDGYAKAGNVDSARGFFNEMPSRNVISWNIMLALYVRVKDYKECLNLFDEMVGMKTAEPNEATLVSVLTASSHLGELERGKSVHFYIENNKKIKPDNLLLTSLITMYAKCGDMDLARIVFDEMPNRNVVSFNSMIMGYGNHGYGEKSLEMFVEMEKSGIEVNDATFVCVLSSCAHSGMVLEGWWYFNLMKRVYKIEPKVEHYGCMIDLLGRAGLMNECEEIITKMPMDGGMASWGALLSACRTFSNVGLGEIVAKKLIRLDPDDIGAYILLSNIYAGEGRWDDVHNVRSMMKDGNLKIAGSSSIQCSDHKRIMVYSMLSELGAQIKLAGCSS